MKFNCTQLALTKALNTVTKAVSTRTTLPVLRGILLTAKENKLYLTASDLDLSIETAIDVSVEKEGSVVVNASLFENIIRKLPNAMIKIELIDKKLCVSCLGSSFAILSIPADEFPPISVVNELKKVNLDKESFKDLVKKTSFAASVDEKKGVLTGVLLVFEEDNIEFVALDGYRMAVACAEVESGLKNRMIVPARILNEIGKIISETDEAEDVSLIIDEKRIAVVTSNTRVIVRLLDGEFIKYRDIIPAQYKTLAVVSRDDMLASIERAALLVKTNNLIKMSVTNGNIEITSNSEEGNVTENVAAEVSGEDIVIGFNSKYIIDALKAVSDDEVSFEFTSPVSASLIRPVSGTAFTYLVLPVKIKV